MSAIVIKHFMWRQTSSEIIIYVSFNGCIKKTNLILTNNYIKANCPPCILELFLYAEIIEKECKCIIYARRAIFTLKKAESGITWPSLELNSLSKENKQRIREQVWLSGQSSIINCAKNKAEQYNALQKAAIKMQINIDSKNLNAIKAMRDECQRTVNEDLRDWSAELGSKDITEVEGVRVVSNKTFESIGINRHLKCVERSTKEVLRTKYVWNSRGDEHNSSPYNTTNIPQDKTLPKDLQNVTESIKKSLYSCLKETFNLTNDIGTVDIIPRKQGVINMQFSERAFPTPARESSSNMEQEWLMKQVQARRFSNVSAYTSYQHENDPQWLKDKGDEFFKAGNYLAAVSAYTLGMKISNRMSSLHLNRSAAYYALENYKECIKDCSNAMKLMEPKCEANREARAKCYARQGASFCKLRDFQQGLLNLEIAFKLSGFNKSIKCDLITARHFFYSKKSYPDATTQVNIPDVNN